MARLPKSLLVASALGVPALLPFLKAVCASKKSWQARHTGAKIVQQVAILQGCAVLPHLASHVVAVAPGLKDESPKVKTITALSLAALAEARRTGAEAVYWLADEAPPDNVQDQNAASGLTETQDEGQAVLGRQRR